MAKTKKKVAKKKAAKKKPVVRKAPTPETYKPKKKLFKPKFLHLAHHIHDTLLSAPLLIGGFYNWHRVMGGEFDLHAHKKGNLKDYDIIFLGLSKPELEGMLISEIREA